MVKNLARKENWGEQWIIVGDFNDIESNGEKFGGGKEKQNSFKDFRYFIKGNNLIDLGF